MVRGKIEPLEAEQLTVYMSASPNNAGLELVEEAPVPVPAPATSPAPRPSPGGHEALQALLAFSSLQEQIHRRRAREMGDGAGLQAEGAGQLEQFVLDEVLQLVAERALTITGADGVAIALAEGNAIVCRASAGSIAPDPGARLDPNSGFSGACLVSGQIVRCDDSETDPRVDVLACRRLGTRSMVAVPLSARQTVIGLLEAFSSESYGFNDSDVRSLNLLAELILSAMRPEEEDRLAEISQRVVLRPAPATSEPEIASSQEEPREQAPVARRDPESPEPTSSPVALPEPEALESSRPGLAVVIVLVLFAISLGAGLWWSISRNSHSSSVKPQPVAPAPAPQTPSSPAPLAASTHPAPEEEEGSPALPTPNPGSVLPKVTGIRHWSSTDSSTVVIDLQDQVQYEAHRLTNPERIYFDLHDTRLADELSGKTITTQDGLLQRIRVAQPFPGVTRVVLLTKGASSFSVSLESNPYRLVVEVRKVGAQPRDRARVDLFAPSQPGSSEQTVTGQNQQKPLVASAQPTGAGGSQVRALEPKLRIVLDAGHGGWDLGTVGRKGLLEKDLVLDIVERLGKLVGNRLGAEVIYTRNDDSYLALEKRAEIANLSRADLFLSVHANYSDYPSARGVETYYSNMYSSLKARPRESDEAEPALQNINWTNVDIREKVTGSRRFAASVQRALYGTLAANNPGLPNRGVKEARYVVLTGTSMPAILAEISFLSSSTDENNLQSSTYRQQIAEALYRGVARYAGETIQVKMASNVGKPVGR